jgi:hypothetical protein
MKFEKATKEELNAGLKALEESCENRFCLLYDEWKNIKCKLNEFIGDFNMKKCKCRKSFNSVIDNRIQQCEKYINDGKLKDPMKLVDIMDCRLDKKLWKKHIEDAFANGTLGKNGIKVD